MILVLSKYRTGSTNLCKQLAEQYSYENLDECFHESIADKHNNIVRYISTNPNCVVKVFPYHLKQSSRENLLNELVALSEKIILLIRKDFDQQVKSYYICKQTGNWHNKFNDTVDITLDKDMYQKFTNFLHNEYLELDTIRKTIPNHEIIYTHQLDQSKKYVRPVKWDRQPGFTNIDIEELFV